MGPSEYYQAGQLQEAISAAINEVKASPTDTAKRFQLCELCCFAGDWERADRQLDTIMQQTTDAVMQITLVRQLIRAELARTEFLQQGRLPEFVTDVTPHLRLHLDASIAIREGKAPEAANLLEQAEQQHSIDWNVQRQFV
ncbi:MAG: tetratricopeptide repeat protein [Pirellulaceae bacterium]